MSRGGCGPRKHRNAVPGNAVPGGVMLGSAIAAAAVLALACSTGAALAGDVVQRQPGERGSVETVHFGDRRHGAVKLVRGPAAPVKREVVSFGNGTAERVTIVRGTVDPAAAAPDAAPLRQALLVPQKTVEHVSFAGATQAGVTVVRGGAGLREAFSADLFGPASPGELDRIAFAVHGVESSHGTNPRMWRPDLDGPQGPMQVSAAAALDVGGGNRFDITENRLLGRAYLARMFQRYGNWPDALAAYNWGPGNVDGWIARGRSTDRLPTETIRYIERVLRDALITTAVARRF